MMSPNELAEQIIKEFDHNRSERIGVFLVEALRRQGVGRYHSETLADELKTRVLDVLRHKTPADLPFQLSQTDPEWLIGKGR